MCNLRGRGEGAPVPPVRDLAPTSSLIKFLVSVTEIWDENLLIICLFYVTKTGYLII